MRDVTALLKTKTTERDEKRQSRDETKRRTGHKGEESGDRHLGGHESVEPSHHSAERVRRQVTLKIK